MPFLPPAAALSRAIAAGKHAVPMFKLNDRWLKKPEPDQAPAEPRPEPRHDVRVWRFDDHSGMTSTGFACQQAGEPEAASERARNGWKTRRAAADGGR